MNEYFEDAVEIPGYREWEAFELRSLLNGQGFFPERDGLWVNPDKGYGMIVSHLGSFVGWLDTFGGRPGPLAPRLMDVQHIPRLYENSLFAEAVDGLEKARLAASVQCRHCGEVHTPGGIAYERTCWECATRVDGITY